MQNNIIKIKAHLKLSRKSVGQGRGGLEGTVRPSQLRAGALHRKIWQSKKTVSYGKCSLVICLQVLS